MHGAEQGRERGPGRGETRHGRPASAPGQRARAAALPRYSGGTSAVLTCATNMQDRVSAGPSGSDRCGVSMTRLENKLKIRIQTRSNNFKFSSNFDSSKRCLPLLHKFQIKYSWKDLEMRNNFA
jgi:hypothetical protein